RWWLSPRGRLQSGAWKPRVLPQGEELLLGCHPRHASCLPASLPPCHVLLFPFGSRAAGCSCHPDAVEVCVFATRTPKLAGFPTLIFVRGLQSRQSANSLCSRGWEKYGMTIEEAADLCVVASDE